MGRSLWFCFAMLVACATALAQTTTTLTPDKDNTLIQNSAGNLSDGAGQAVFAGRTNQSGNIQIRRALLHFNLSTIPAGANITSASLRLTAENRGQNGDRTMVLHRVIQDWGQGTSNAAGVGAPATTNDATWLYRFYNTAAPTSSPLWSTQGGAFNAASSGSAICPNLGGNFTMSGNSASQMVADIRAWLADSTSNFGWILIGDESVASTAKKIYSREWPTASQRPTLSITYTVPEPAGLLLIGMVAGLAFRRR